MIADQLEFGNTVFHNGKFDLKFIIQMFKKLGIDYVFGKIGDTMLLNYCLDERPWGKYGAHSLKNISRVNYDAPDYDIEMGKWLNEYRKADDERKQEMLAQMYNYLALDCYYTARLGKDLTQAVSDESEKLLTFYNQLLMPASMALTDIELHGCKLDRKYLESMRDKLIKELEVSTRKIREYAEEPELNPGSPKQMYKLLYRQLGLPVTKTKRRGKVQDGPTSQPVIRLLRKNHPEHRQLLDEIIRWRRIQKTLGTYVYGLLDRMEWDDYIRCDYLLHGTTTGRLSSANPNLQNIPDESHIGFNIRTAFIPENDDWILLESDYSQLELRVAAHETGDKNLIKVYQDDGDLHKDVTDAVFVKQDITPYERSLAKNMVFGAVYKRGPESMSSGAEMDYVETELGGKRWTLNETQHFFNVFLGKYPQLPIWQKKQIETAYSQRVLSTELGRLRRFPLVGNNDKGTVGRQAVNFPIQSLASDITLDALIRIHKRLTALNRQVGKTVAHIVLTVHDSITAAVHKKYVKRVKKIIAEEMASVPIDTVVPFKAKMAIGKNWGDCK